MLWCVLLLDEAFVIGGIRRFVKAGCQPEVGELYVTVLVYEDVVRFNITERALSVMHMVMLVPLTGE